jgi:hypothetical protein
MRIGVALFDQAEELDWAEMARDIEYERSVATPT